MVLRQQHQTQKDLWNAKLEEFKQQHKTQIEGLHNTSESLAKAEEDLRSEAIKEYKTTGEKKLFGGVGIRILKKLSYDEHKAYVWAVNKQMAIKLDKKAFEKMAKAAPEHVSDFVEFKEEPQATIPTEIGKGYKMEKSEDGIKRKA